MAGLNKVSVDDLQAKGKKILVRGNHDPHSLTEYMDMGFVLACSEFAMNLDGMKSLSL